MGSVELARISHHDSGRAGLYRPRKKLAGTVILSIDSLAAAHDGQKLGPRKGSDLFFRTAAFPCPSGTSSVKTLKGT
jgi:hypothetical protein